jgi:hypothetical protein
MVELQKSHGMDVDHFRFAEHLSKAIFTLKQEGEVESIRRGHYRLTTEGLKPAAGDKPSEMATEGSVEETFVIPSWAEDTYLVGLVANTLGCYGFYGTKSDSCKRCPIVDSCHAQTVTLFTKCISSLPEDEIERTVPVIDDKYIDCTIVGQEGSQCAKTGIPLVKGDTAYYLDGVGVICKDAADQYIKDNPAYRFSE